MQRRPRRNHTPAFKAKVALAAIKGDRTLAHNELWIGRAVHRRQRGGSHLGIRVGTSRIRALGCPIKPDELTFLVISYIWLCFCRLLEDFSCSNKNETCP